MSYRCRICDKEFAEIPATAVELLSHRQSYLYRFADGAAHDLLHITSKRRYSQAMHTRFHKDKLRDECEFCFPPKPEPPEQTEVQVPETLLEPEPQPEVVVAAEIEPVSMTAMEAAFRRSLLK